MFEASSGRFVPGQQYRLPNGVVVTFHDNPTDGWTFRSVRNRFEFYQVKGDGSLAQFVLRVGKRTSAFEPIVGRPTGFTLDDLTPLAQRSPLWRRLWRAVADTFKG